MFEGFFYELKHRGVPVSLTEWMCLHQALEKDLPKSSLTGFYYLARAILVKNETYFDRYDQAFQNYFKGIDTPDEMLQQIMEGLEKVDPLELDELAKAAIPELSLAQVMENFKKQFEEGHFKGHKGGNQAIGTGGTSTQGAFGYNPAGIRISQGGSRHGRAIKIAEKRLFRNYSPDQVLDTRQLRVALSKLRTLLPRGPEDELDLDRTIDKTCRNAGDLELVWQRQRKNTIKLLLLMDSGGSMAPYARLVSLLFSAAKSQFRDMKHYYFHNCVYQDLWKDIQSDESVPTEEVLRTLSDDYKVVIVGDATMAPSELLDRNGCISWFYQNDEPGVWWLHKISQKFPASIWINPEPERFWVSITARIIRRIFPMFHLSLEGLDDAIPTLLNMKRPQATAAEISELVHKRISPYLGPY